MIHPHRRAPARVPATATSTGSACALTLTLALTLLLGGCASVGAPEQTQLLGKDLALQLQADGSKSWHSSTAEPYEAVHIDPSAIAFGTEVQLDPEQREQLRQALVTALRERFAAAGWRLLEAPQGRRTLRLRAAVTEVQLASPGANIITTLLLIGPLSHGGVTVEIEARDADTGQAVAALAFKGRAGVEDFSSAYSATGHALLQAELLAQRFVKLLAAATPGGPRGEARGSVVPGALRP